MHFDKTLHLQPGYVHNSGIKLSLMSIQNSFLCAKSSCQFGSGIYGCVTHVISKTDYLIHIYGAQGVLKNVQLLSLLKTQNSILLLLALLKTSLINTTPYISTLFQVSLLCIIIPSLLFHLFSTSVLAISYVFSTVTDLNLQLSRKGTYISMNLGCKSIKDGE